MIYGAPRSKPSEKLLEMLNRHWHLILVRYVIMMLNVHCQLGWASGHLGDIPLYAVISK